MTKLSTQRWSGLAAMFGGLLWTLIWVHFLLTHGPGPENLQGRLLTLTWIDSAKFLAIPLALFGFALPGLHARERERASLIGRVGYALARIGVTVLILGVVLQFWFMPWRSYAEADWNTLVARIGGPMQVMSGFVLSSGLILFGIDIVRTHPLRRWNALPISIGVLLFTLPFLHMTLHAGLFGLAWVVLGYSLWSSQEQRQVQQEPHTAEANTSQHALPENMP